MEVWTNRRVADEWCGLVIGGEGHMEVWTNRRVADRRYGVD